MNLQVSPGALDPHSEDRLDFRFIASMVEPGSRVLDVGCGDGSLLSLLRDTRSVDGRGIELSREGVSACMAKGLVITCMPGSRWPWLSTAFSA